MGSYNEGFQWAVLMRGFNECYSEGINVLCQCKVAMRGIDASIKTFMPMCST